MILPCGRQTYRLTSKCGRDCCFVVCLCVVFLLFCLFVCLFVCLLGRRQYSSR